MGAKAKILPAAVLLTALSAAAAWAQPPPPIPIPVPPPAPSVPPTPPPAAPLFDETNPDGLSADQGLLFGVELDFTKPHVRNRVSGTTTFPDGSTAVVQAPQTNLVWTVAPSLELGYRLGQDFGDLDFTYRFLISEGNADGLTPFGDVNFHSRLDVSQFDFDYAGARYSPAPFWDLKGRVGIRLADVFFDSAAQLDGLADERVSNNFIGAGPHFGLDAERRFPALDGLAAFGRIDGAVMVGQIHQRFREGFVLNDGTNFAGDDTRRGTQSVPMLSLQAGFSYTPQRMDYIHFAFGYQFEDWWNVGRLNGSRGELNDQGVFFRGEFDY